MLFTWTSLAQSESANPKSTTLYLYNMSLFLVTCRLDIQRATIKQCKVPTKEDQRLDHAKKLETFPSGRFHSLNGKWGQPITHWPLTVSCTEICTTSCMRNTKHTHTLLRDMYWFTSYWALLMNHEQSPWKVIKRISINTASPSSVNNGKSVVDSW
jgi:hypothetical protein